MSGFWDGTEGEATADFYASEHNKGEKMSQTITGIIQEVQEGVVKSGRSAGQPYWTITLRDGGRITCFDGDFVQELDSGKEYEITYDLSKDQRYMNLAGKPVPVWRPSEETEVTATTTEKDSKAQYWDNERACKNRISALQAGVNYIVGTMAGTHSDADLWKTIKRFEEYINTGG